MNVAGKARVVTAKYPNHRLARGPDASCRPLPGFWTSWLPFALPQCWPFCWWVAVAIDHFSRRAMGFAVFAKQPTSVAVRTFLGRAVGKAETTPKYLICDRGTPIRLRWLSRLVPTQGHQTAALRGHRPTRQHCRGGTIYSDPEMPGGWFALGSLPP